MCRWIISVTFFREENLPEYIFFILKRNHFKIWVLALHWIIFFFYFLGKLEEKYKNFLEKITLINFISINWIKQISPKIQFSRILLVFFNANWPNRWQQLINHALLLAADTEISIRAITTNIRKLYFFSLLTQH